MARLALMAVALALAAVACSGSDDPAPAGPLTGPPPAEPGDNGAGDPVPNEDRTVSPGDSPPSQSFAGVDPAPEFPPGLDWLNTDQPLTLEALRGKVVLLDFWTYGCINCIHIIPDLKRLELEYPNELTVIGVHSAKFLNESETDNIRQVILRYEIEHPVVNDSAFAVWNNWGANAWPTTVLVDPVGNIVGGHSGEGVYDVVAPVVRSLIDEFDELGLLDRTPIDFALEHEGAPDTVLSFPGKVLADPAGERLFVADTGHHRIVTTTADGNVLAVYGSGKPGYLDGAALGARFHAPQGMALSSDGRTLFVADTNNHAIRSIDLTTNTVETLAGTGELGWPPTPAPLTQAKLNSPWDVELRDGILYVAMAGHHQLWAIDLAAGIAAPLVGNGRESTANGPLAEAELAQPSGLAFDTSGRLYFADSESSSIRYADVLHADGGTGVVAGSDQTLFDFGDEDGTGTDARLQHPLGVAYHEATGALLIADTYNSKLKRITLDDNAVTTFLGEEQGWADGSNPSFNEPGGLSLDGDTLYVADTNNHVIRAVNVFSGETTTLVIKGIAEFLPTPDDVDYQGKSVTLAPATIGPGTGSLVLDVALPEGFKVNEEAPSSLVWKAPAGIVVSEDSLSLMGTKFPVEIDAEFSPGSGALVADLNLVYCRADAESLCFFERVRLSVPVTVETGATNSVVVVSHEVPTPSA